MFNYYGSKHRVIDTYPPPLLDTIIEPFAGSAAYAVRHRRRARRVVLVEKDIRIVEVWRRLLTMSADEVRSLPEPVPGQECSDFLVALASARTTRDTPRTFTVSTRMVDMFRIMVRRLALEVEECRHFEVICGDYSDAPDIAATWFIDPPYQYQGGRWDRTRGGRYTHPNTEIDYAALGRWARTRQGQVIVCEQAGADWLEWNGHFGGQASSGDLYSEVWWTNEVVTPTLW